MNTLFRIIGLIVILLAVAVPSQARDKFLKSKGQQLSYREASAYSNTGEKRDIIVGVEFLPKAGQKRQLGSKTGKFDVLEVAITNNSRFRLYVNNVEMLDGGALLQSVSLDDVAKATGPSGGGNKKGMQLSILRNNLIDKSLQANVVLPGETIQGLVFAHIKKEQQGIELKVDIQNLKRLVYLDIVVPIAQ